MKLNSLLLFVAGAFALAGCSSTPTHVDTGPIHARTFNFVNRGVRPSPGFEDDHKEVHEMIQSAITTNLASHGVTRVDSGGDVTVGYLIIVGNNVSTEMISEYFGYGQDAVGLQDKAHKAYTSYDSPNYFQAGTLVVDIIDSQTNKLLRRRYVVKPLLRTVPAEQRPAKVQEAVDEIMAGVQFVQ